MVRYDRGDGTLAAVPMRPGESFHIPVGAPHQFIAVTDCIVFEASLPVFDDRINVADRYREEVST